MPYRKPKFDSYQKPILGTQLNLAHPMARGLVALWLLNEGAGLNAFDLTGNRNSGVLVNGPSWVPGRNGIALSLDGADDYISLSVVTGTTFTYSAWIKPNSSINVYCSLFSNSGGEPGIFYSGSNAGSNVGKINFYTNSSHFSNSALTDGVWNHLAVVVDGGVATFYINGAASGSFSSVSSFTVDRMGNDNSNESFKGSLGDVRFYNRTLSATEITRIITNSYEIFHRPKVGLRQSPAAGGSSILKYDSVAQASIGKANGVSAASIKKIMGVTM